MLHGRLRGTLPRCLALALTTCTVAPLAACTPPPTTEAPPLSRAPSLGELVYRILKEKLQASDTCPTQYVAALEANHEDFVTTFDFTLNVEVTNDLPDVLGGTIVPMVESGQLPRLVDQLAESTALLISDEFDPNRDTLKSLVKLSNARTMLEGSMVFELVDAVLSDSTINDKIHSLALLAQEHDGVDYVLDDALGLVRSALAYESPVTCSGLTIPDVQSTVFRTSGFVEDASLGLGLPAYSARPDSHYNPRVRVDVMTGTLAAPFVDTTPADGEADVNAEGEPIDAGGNVIDIPILGYEGNRDVYGRALNEHGGLLYDYFDVKRSAVSYLAQIGADFIEGGYLHDVAPLMTAALGDPVTCTYGTPVESCREYAADGDKHPIADIFFLGTDILRFPKLVDFLDGLQQVLTADPNKAETLLMTAGDIVTALDATDLSLTDTALIDNGLSLLPIVDDLFSPPASPPPGYTSTPRLITDAIHNLGPMKAQIAPQLGSLIEYHALTSSVPAPADAVDFSQPRFYTNGSGAFVDNRSVLEILLDVIPNAQCGDIHKDVGGGLTVGELLYQYLDDLLYPGADAPTAGNLAQVMVDAASRATPEQLKTLLGVLDWFTSGSNSGTALRDTIMNLGCSSTDADALAAALPVFKSLQNSGVLDWALPIAQIFGSQGQRDIVIAMAVELAQDLQQDGGPYTSSGNHHTVVTSTQSVIRRLEPALLSIAKSGALTRLLDALDTLYTVQVGGSNALQLLLDTAAYLVDIAPAGIPTRQGVVANTSRAIEMLEVMRTLAVRTNAAGANDELSHLIHFATGYVQRTDELGVDAKGVHYRRLHFRNLRLLLAIGSQLLHDAAQLSDTDFTCYLDGVQSEGIDFLVKRDFAQLVRIANQLLVSPNSAGLESWIVSFLRGMPEDPFAEPYGHALQILAAVASSDPDQVTEADLANITHWASGVVDMTTGASARDIIATVDAIVVADTNGVLFQIARNAVRTGPLESGEIPLITLADIYQDVGTIESTNMCMATADGTWTVEQIESTISGVLDFVNDDENGLGAIWDLIGKVAPAEPAP